MSQIYFIEHRHQQAKNCPFPSLFEIKQLIHFSHFRRVKTSKDMIENFVPMDGDLIYTDDSNYIV